MLVALLSPLLVTALTAALPFAAQDGLAVATVLEGRVSTAGGAPAAGAVVISSAGGRAVTDEDGFFRLELRLAPEIDSLRVSAFRGAGDAQSAVSEVVTGLRPGATQPVGVLALVQGATCSPDWLPTFGSNLLGTSDGTSAEIEALAVFDDRSGVGPMLFVGGTFTSAGNGGANHLARWDGLNWTPVGTGTNGDVNALLVVDEPSGPVLVAGGSFTSVNGVSANRIARWDGTTWSGFESRMNGSVRALATFDDGTGPALVSGGEFTTAGGVSTNYVAKWDGSHWSPLAAGVTGTTETVAVYALAVHDDGSGPALIAGGLFSQAGSVGASNIARWDGSQWSALGAGRGGRVHALAVFDDGSGPALYAGGRSAAGVDLERVGRWDGSTWLTPGLGFDGSVLSFLVFDDGGGPALYAGGDFTASGGAPMPGMAKWNGSQWSSLAAGITGGGQAVHALAAFDGVTGMGPSLCAGGSFTLAGDRSAHNFAKWSGGAWSVGNRITNVEDLVVFDDGTGPALYAGGSFFTAGGLTVLRVARWNGVRWTALSSGIDSVSGGGSVFDLGVFDLGDGPALYAAGSFTRAGGHPAPQIAKWDGSAWSRLGPALGDMVEALELFDEGNGGGLQLYAAVDNFAASSFRVVRWNGSSYASLGLGMNSRIQALATFDDGGGSALYAAGSFPRADNLLVNKIARWNGSSWSDLAGGLPGATDIESLIVFDDGTGPALYAGGYFLDVNGLPVNHIAKWDGTSWSSLANGVNGRVTALAVIDDGSGTALFVGGEFTSASGVAANGLARWNGVSWSSVDAGLSTASAIVTYDDGRGGGPALFVGGDFLTSTAGDSYMARRRLCPDTTPPVLDCPERVLAEDRWNGAPGEVVTFSVSAQDLDRDVTVQCVPPSGSFFPRGTTPVTCTATDSHGNQATCAFPVIVAPKALRR
jgi:hypothetical protein